MATVTIVCDTETNEIEVNIDGEKFTDVNSASVGIYETYDDEEKTMVSIVLEPEKVSHLTKRVYVSSAKAKAAQEAIANKTTTWVSKDSHIVKYETQHDVNAAVAKMLGKNKNS
jgi:hypothetical protein